MNSEHYSNQQIDSILKQVREHPPAAAGKSHRSSDRELNAILRELGIGTKKPKKQAEPILVSFPGAEEEQAIEQLQKENQGQQGQPAAGVKEPEEDEPFVEDLHAAEQASELPTLELPTIKAYSEAEAQKQEEERRRIVERAQREAQHTIHNAAQFAMQMEISRQMAAINGDDVLEDDEIHLGNNLFGEVDDQFRAFFGRTVVADKEAVEEAVSGHKKKRGLFARLLRRKNRQEAEDDAFLTGEFDALLPPAPDAVQPSGWQQGLENAAPAPEPAEEMGRRETEEPALTRKAGRKKQKDRFKTADEDAARRRHEAAQALPKWDTDTLQELGVDTSATASSERFRTRPRRGAGDTLEHVNHLLSQGKAVGLNTLLGEGGTGAFATGKNGLTTDLLTLHTDEGKPMPAKQPRPRKARANAVYADGASDRASAVSAPLQEGASQVEEYSALSDAPVVAQNLATMSKTRLLRTVASGLIALVLTYMGVAANSSLPVPELLDPMQRPLFFLLANFVLLALSSLLSVSTLQQGFLGLTGDPTTDTFVALADAGALLQNLGYLILEIIPGAEGYHPDGATLFGPIAAALLFACALGKWMQIGMISRNFAMASSGSEHAAAFLMPQMQLVKRLCTGLGEPDPVLLVSRPTALVKGFLAQSFSARLYDAMAQKLSYVLGGAALVCAVIAGLREQSVEAALGGLAGALCLAAPAACTLVYAVPARLMQKYASAHGAVIPGPSAIQALGRANTVLLNARDLFPMGSVRLHGIKTFEKERIDIAILYAASILARHCDTLKGIFLSIIQNNTKMLYNVESVTQEAGYGFTGWIEHNRVIIGNREMMQRHDIEIPSLDYERKYTQDGKYAPIYLAVSGKLFGMFIVSYMPSRGAARILNRLTARGISILVQSEDFNVTSELVSATYRVPKGTVKVLSQPECDALNAETAYRATSEGVMIHSGSCASFLAGMRAASCAAEGERLARMVQAGAIVFSAVVSVVLAFAAGLPSLNLGVVLGYQLAWAAITVAMPMLKRP